MKNSMSIPAFRDQIVKPSWRKDLPKKDRIHHAAYTVVTEASEVVDVIKKAMYSPRHKLGLEEPSVIAHLKEEVGDTIYGLLVVCEELDIDIEECTYEAAMKLKYRYPDIFERPQQ